MGNGFLQFAPECQRFWAAVVLVGALASMGAQARTKNFIVSIDGATPKVARRVGEWAEYHRKKRAMVAPQGTVNRRKGG
jgi:hypothetical protein